MSKSRVIWILLLDIIILVLSFLLMAAFKPGTPNYLSMRYLAGFGTLLSVWLLASVYFKKYHLKRKIRLEKIIQRIFLSNLFAVSSVAIFVIGFELTGYSRLVFFGTAGIATFAEIFIANLYFLLIHTLNGKTDLYNPPPKAYFIRFGDSALDLMVVCYVAQWTDQWSSGEEIRMGFKRALEEAGIEIPFPQRDIHIRRE